jgi:hypothetical protein
MVKVVPLSTVLSAEMMPWVMDNPRPVPLPTGLVVKLEAKWVPVMQASFLVGHKDVSLETVFLPTDH